MRQSKLWLRRNERKGVAIAQPRVMKPLLRMVAVEIGKEEIDGRGFGEFTKRRLAADCSCLFSLCLTLIPRLALTVKLYEASLNNQTSTSWKYSHPHQVRLHLQ